MRELFKLIRKGAIAIVFSLFFIIVANAETYSRTGTKSIWTALGTVTTNCTGTYHVDGNTRWTVYGNWSCSLLYSYVSFSKYVPYDTCCEVTANASVTDSSYQHANGSGTFTFYYHPSTHIVSVY